MGQLHIRKMSRASAFKLWSRAGQGDLSYKCFGSETRGRGWGGHSGEDPIIVSRIIRTNCFKQKNLVLKYLFS